MTVCVNMVIDANCVQRFQKERIESIDGPAILAFNHILKTGTILLDETNLIRQDWQECAGTRASHLNLNDWVADRLQEGRIRHFPFTRDRALDRNLRALGVPRSDRKYLQFANSSSAFGIVSDDIDLFDPSKKAAKGPVKERIKIARSGPICRFARKQLNIEIMPLVSVPEVVPVCDG